MPVGGLAYGSLVSKRLPGVPSNVRGVWRDYAGSAAWLRATGLRATRLSFAPLLRPVVSALLLRDRRSSLLRLVSKRRIADATTSADATATAATTATAAAGRVITSSPKLDGSWLLRFGVDVCCVYSMLADQYVEFRIALELEVRLAEVGIIGCTCSEDKSVTD